MKSYKSDTEFIVENSSYLLEFLLSKLNYKSKNNIKSLLLHDNVSVNGKIINKYNYELKPADKVIIKWSQVRDERYKLNLDIIHEDDDIIVINKPAGLLSIATDKENEKTAYHMVMNYLKRKNLKSRVFIVHRLDRDTSGVLLFAKNEKIKHLLQDDWNNIVLVRNYIAIVEGNMGKEEGTIKSWLKETKTQIVYSSHVIGDGQEAITHYKKLKSKNNYSLLDIAIDTGRKNQIRVHMNELGHSIIGDKKYYAKTDPLKRLGLHANVLAFKHPLTKKVMRFEAPIPTEFMKLF